ncbi:MAG: NAD(P)/FAD-dependent oxidoreductase, partial [Pseudomonadota bacterium]
MSKVDHVIVGSGINALVAASLLAKKDRKVLVLERSDVAGGCMRTEEVTLPGYHHDVMAATFVLFLTSPSFGELSEDLARHGLEFCHTTDPTAVLRPDGSALVVKTDRAANVSIFNELQSGDGDRHAEDVGAIEADAPFLFAILGGQLWSWSTTKMLIGQVRKRGFRGLVNWVGDGMIPARGWLETTYESPLVQALWAPWVLHTGLTPEGTYSGQMGKVIAFALEAAGAPVAKGGSAQAVAAFKGLIEEKGGEVRTGVDVDKIIVEDGRAVGVVTSTGERIDAADVVASVAPGQLHDRLLRDTETDHHEQAKSYRHGRGNFQVHYALDKHP